MVYDRDTATLSNSKSPGGVYGQISMRRLCETLEACGEIQPTEHITHLDIAGDLIRYRVERRAHAADAEGQ